LADAEGQSDGPRTNTVPTHITHTKEGQDTTPLTAAATDHGASV